ncbi:hypothetical protein N431DRAFT_453923 [Stipitochalara longipes BDJ]|nr:hypothetical protein N431DRAFT_453923 [Stipitochalara longipes BDJ]
MQEAREEVTQYARSLAKPSNQIEAALTRADQPGPTVTDLDKEALKLLEIERDALAAAWDMLKKDLSEKGKDDNIMGPAPATFESVISSAEDAKTEMNSRKKLGGGKPRDYYNKFCQKAHQHRSVFDMFPNTNEYVSIFCGSIKTLINASVNYIQISEGLSRAFDEITELVDFAKRQVGGVPTLYTRIALAKLYKEIFLYLKDCTDWFTRTSKARALRSFNEDFYKCFSDRMDRVKSIATTVHQEATIGGIQNIQVMLARTEDLEQQRRRHWEDEMTRWRMERQQMMQDRESGLRARGVLEDTWHSDQGQRARIRRIETLQDNSQTTSLSDDIEETSSPKLQQQSSRAAGGENPLNYQRNAVLEASKGLEKFIIGNSVDLLNTLPPASFASIPVATKLREWLSSRISTFLWVRGPPASHYPSDLSALSGSLINAALGSKIPILFHFCEPAKSVDLADGLNTEEAGVVSLVYSLIRQLILLLEPDVDASIDFSAERLSLLESPLGNWREVISFLNDLLTLSPGILLCVIDGIDDLDYGRGKSLCADILALMRRREAASARSGLILKTLFTTTGYAKTLDDGLGLDEVVIDTESRHLSRGSMGPGQKSIFDERI